jgi:selenide,water dikinase
MDGVHALTDVTGFGLAGHALELARGAKAAVSIEWARVPLLAGVRALAEQGMVTGASERNWGGYGTEVKLPEGFSPTDQALLTDPQTSGGLLVSCDANVVADVLAVFRRHGFEAAAEIGEIVADAGSGARLSLR